MTPQEKAQELVDKFINASFNCKDCDMPFCDTHCTILNLYEAKQCALIAVDEVISIGYWEYMDSGSYKENKYWQEVKEEIEKL
jgi:hypothetical protein